MTADVVLKHPSLNTTEPNSIVQMIDVSSVKLFNSQNPVVYLSLYLP